MREFRRRRQPVNLICAIALPFRTAPGGLAAACGSPRSRCSTPAAATRKAPRTGGSGAAPAGLLQAYVGLFDPTPTRLSADRAQKNRAGPGGVQRDHRRALVVGGRGPWGRTPVGRSNVGQSRNGNPEMPGYAVFQASLRCCGMPASRARTSASR